MKRRFAVAYVITLVVFLALDAVWLTTMAPLLYRPAIGHLMLDEFRPLPALAFYLLYVAGIVTFAVMPGLARASAGGALARGALFGLVAYATYDLTNQATLRGWPWVVTLADLCWGTFVTAAAAAAACRLTPPIASNKVR
jgi:uncharacterized membrane protein